MRISIAQINSTVGDFAGNSEKIIAFAKRAKEEQKADIVLFPEMALCGFPALDLLERDSFVEAAIKAAETLTKELPSGIATGLGYIGKNPGSGGKKLLNLYGIFLDGKIVFEQAKKNLSIRNGFDEARYFEPASEQNTFRYKGEMIDFIFCDDLAFMKCPSEEGGEEGLAPDTSVPQAGFDGLCTVLCVPAAAAYGAGNHASRMKTLERFVDENEATAVYVNAAGANGEVILDGRSFAFLPVESAGPKKSRLVLSAKAFEEDLLPLDTRDNSGGEKEPRPGEIKRNGLDLLEEALVVGIRDYMRKSGFKQAHLGLSGGIDSAIVAYLAVKAAGPENVIGISMPSRFSSQGSKDDAAELAVNLGCHYETIPIEDCYAAFISALEGIFENRPFDVTEENLQARIRGVLLMAYSNKFGSMLLTTGNKSEIAMGYCTLYGDTNGALAPIGDVFKTDVFDLCRRINERSTALGGKPIIPLSTIDKPPSAELRPDQKDEDSLPPYKLLDAILWEHLCLKHSAREIKARYPLGNGELIDRVITAVARSEFKRRQLPPALWVSGYPFGPGRKIPLVTRGEQ